MSPTTSRWVSVARASEIPLGGSRLVRLDDVPVAVFHLDDGWYAITRPQAHALLRLIGATDIEGTLPERE